MSFICPVTRGKAIFNFLVVFRGFQESSQGVETRSGGSRKLRICTKRLPLKAHPDYAKWQRAYTKSSQPDNDCAKGLRQMGR